MRDASQQLARKRVAFLCLIAVLWVVAIVARLVQLQVLEHEQHSNYARSQQTRHVKLVAPRGAIFERNGKPLALSLEHESMAINPMRVPNAAEAASALAGAFSLDAEHLEKKIRRYQENRWGFLWIRRWMNKEEQEAAHALKGGWIEYYKESKRHYPKGTLASHVIGSVGVDGNGLFGLEQQLNYVLQGEDGNETLVQDVRQQAIDSEVINAPQPGIAVRLTIDERIQNAAEAALGKAINQHKVPSGSVVVMDPRSGDILAMASYPDFDPNMRPRSRKEMEHRFNRAISMEYEPGSVFKVVTLAAGLEQTKLRPDTPISCGNGLLRLPGRTIRDAHSYDILSFADVLAKSSNIGAIFVAFAVGKNLMYEYVKAFGFGSKTGLPLPYEQAGYVWPMHDGGSKKLYGNVLASVAMGHQISATTVQLAQACSVIANGGTLVKPRLVMNLRAPDGKLTTLASERGERVLQPETAITMRKLMEGVMLTGTGKTGRLQGWTSGGKTGTAQIFDRKLKRYIKSYNSSFLGFAPLHNPAIVVVVTLNETRLYGGTIAAPVFREVASDALRILNVQMDNPTTVLADAKPPSIEDLAEGDLGLADEASAGTDAAMLPDTRKEIMAVLAAALKEDPEIEDWMLGNPQDSLAPTFSELAPLPASPVSGMTPIGSGVAKPSWLREMPGEDTARAERAFEEAARLFPAELQNAEASMKTVVFVDAKVTPDFLGKSMRAVVAESMRAGLDLQPYGRGVARKQIPPPGTRIPQGVPVRVVFAP